MTQPCYEEVDGCRRRLGRQLQSAANTTLGDATVVPVATASPVPEALEQPIPLNETAGPTAVSAPAPVQPVDSGTSSEISTMRTHRVQSIIDSLNDGANLERVATLGNWHVHFTLGNVYNSLTTNYSPGSLRSVRKASGLLPRSIPQRAAKHKGQIGLFKSIGGVYVCFSLFLLRLASKSFVTKSSWLVLGMEASKGLNNM